MKTREDSLNEFIISMDELCKEQYLFAGQYIYKVVNRINTSKLLFEIVKYFCDSYDFEGKYNSYLKDSDIGKYMTAPVDKTDIIPFVYLLLTRSLENKIVLTDVMEYMGEGKDFSKAYKRFCDAFLIPFKNSMVTIAEEVINNTGEEGSRRPQQKAPATVDIEEEGEEEEIPVVEPKLKRAQNILRLIDLDRLAVSQSRIRDYEKDELFFVLDVLDTQVAEGDNDKLVLAYYAYYYAFKPYKKIKTNIKNITAILDEDGVL